MAGASEALRAPELHHRILAAAGASVVSALLVNPLDVVKTRLQASSVVVERPVPSCLLSRYPVRWARPSTLADCASSKLPAGAVSGCGSGVRPAAQGPGSAVGAPHRPLLATLPMSSCACAVKVADLGPGSLGSAEGCLSAAAPYRPPTATGVLRDILRKEGVAALWRGTDTAMLASIPMVGVYMPLYDHLLGRISSTAPPGLLPYAPVLAGSVARTLAVLLVGPLELVRTRQQGGAAGAGSATTAWGALRETLRDTTATATAGGAGAGAGASAATAATGSGATRPASSAAATAALLRGMPRLWTGVVATLGRDVPFSALYWGMLEPLRGALLQRWQEQQDGQGPAASGGGGGGASSGRAVLAANLIAGSTAGAIAAVVTTPFDVVKTRLQVGDVRQRQTGMQVMRQVLALEGPAGLFKGWGPRAARTAPACAVVVASYEVLKLLL
ncbi:hypothetical protein HYH02_011878 [Chlamydomonas schloesseri]|uniref:Mitochondrial carrier protein n=1 Tax=Chlamydomonas schloesseri TaxID=2026947 RepID=A0A835TB00_9CHLO|nr:hypothetical protein HYH02_011878 [Chlamydomonas schloesseri]|eukprot:KAG2435585.1 hypothetical protein HYH02_011878 [Chlamydomonas schloesseri]